MFRHNGSVPRSNVQPDVNSIKPPKAPDRPLVPYMRFSRKMWAKVRAERPDCQLWDIGKILGHMWHNASDAERAVYQQEYEIEKAEYEKALKAYHNSASYQQYLAAKNRAKLTDKGNTIGAVISSSNRTRYDSGCVVIQPVEDDELGDLSSRRVAAVRFDRNHRLMADLFNNNIVTDARTVIAQNRVEMIRKQAHSLGSHQSKLDDELKALEETFRAKKRQIEASSEEFAIRLKKVCEERPFMDDEAYQKRVEHWEKKILTAYAEHKTKQEALRAKQMVEREHLAEETPILYRLTVGDSSPSPNALPQTGDCTMKGDIPTSAAPTANSVESNGSRTPSSVTTTTNTNSENQTELT